MNADQLALVTQRYGIDYSGLLCDYLIQLSCWRDSERILRTKDYFYDLTHLKAIHDPNRTAVLATLSELRRLRQSKTSERRLSILPE